MLGWTGAQLRASTMAEYVLALDGWMEARGLKKPSLMGRGELLDLIDKFGAKEVVTGKKK